MRYWNDTGGLLKDFSIFKVYLLCTDRGFLFHNFITLLEIKIKEKQNAEDRLGKQDLSWEDRLLILNYTPRVMHLCGTYLPTFKSPTICNGWPRVMENHPGLSAAGKKTQRQTRVLTLMGFVAEEVSAPDDTGQGIDHRHFKVTFRREQLNWARLRPAAMTTGSCFLFLPKESNGRRASGRVGGVHTLASQVHQVPRDAVLQTSLCPDLWPLTIIKAFSSTWLLLAGYFLGRWLWTSASRPHASKLCVAGWLFVWTSAWMSCLMKRLLSVCVLWEQHIWISMKEPH